MKRFTLMTAAALFGLSIVAVPSLPVDAHPNARITLNLTQGGFVIGGTTGTGYIRYHRRNYPIEVTGLRIGAIIGSGTSHLRGRVSNIQRLSDIEGTYSSIGASATASKGRNLQKFKNEKGVYLDLHGSHTGFEMSLDVGGMRIRLNRN